MIHTAAQRWRRLSTVVLPLVALLFAAVFLSARAQRPEGPPAEALASIRDDPCSLFTSAEMSLVVGARIFDRRRDLQPPRQLCSYHGGPQSAGTIVELGFAHPDDVRRLRGRRFRPSDLIAEIAAGQDVTPIEDLGDEALYIRAATGQLWVRDGDVVLSVAVVRNRTDGDAETARRVGELILAKLNAAGETE